MAVNEGLREIERLNPEQLRLMNIKMLAMASTLPENRKLEPDHIFDKYLNMTMETYPEFGVLLREAYLQEVELRLDEGKWARRLGHAAVAGAAAASVAYGLHVAAEHGRSKTPPKRKPGRVNPDPVALHTHARHLSRGMGSHGYKHGQSKKDPIDTSMTHTFRKGARSVAIKHRAGEVPKWKTNTGSLGTGMKSLDRHLKAMGEDVQAYLQEVDMLFPPIVESEFDLEVQAYLLEVEKKSKDKEEPAKDDLDPDERRFIEREKQKDKQYHDYQIAGAVTADPMGEIRYMYGSLNICPYCAHTVADDDDSCMGCGTAFARENPLDTLSVSVKND